jgi:hypothetical protein
MISQASETEQNSVNTERKDVSIGNASGVVDLPLSPRDGLVDRPVAADLPIPSTETGVLSPALVKFRRPARPARALSRWGPWAHVMWFTIGIAVVAASVEFRILKFPATAPIAPATAQSAIGNKNLSGTVAFGLQADVRELKQGAIIRLQWDPTASVIRNSPVGILSISDGDISHQLVFKRRELDLGYTDYPAVSDEITFRLMVDDAGSPRQQSLLVLLGGRNPARTESVFPLYPPADIRHSDNGGEPNSLKPRVRQASPGSAAD